MIKIYKSFLIVFILLFCSVYVNGQESYDVSVGTTTLKTGISLEDSLPEMFFGTWRVSSHLVSTNTPSKFKHDGVDLWNLSRENNVITLSNPFSGANAEISLQYVEGNKIRFTKKGDYDNMKLTDTVEIELSKDNFTGSNKLLLETLSAVDNSVIKTGIAVYNLRGEKISGSSILGK